MFCCMSLQIVAGFRCSWDILILPEHPSCLAPAGRPLPLKDLSLSAKKWAVSLNQL